MAERRKYKSKIRAAIHEMACDFHEGGLMDADQMAKFDKSCLTPEGLAAKSKSAALAALRKNMMNLHEIGVIEDDKMAEFDRACLTPEASAIWLLENKEAIAAFRVCHGAALVQTKG